jgi:hypothetical protein
MTAQIIPFPQRQPAAPSWDSTVPAPAVPAPEFRRLSPDEVRAILAPARAAIEGARRRRPRPLPMTSAPPPPDNPQETNS